MRTLPVVLTILALSACTGWSDDAETTTTMPTAPSTTATAPATTVPVVTSTPTTTTPEEPSEGGGESITVSERVTITVTDPED